MCLSDDLKWTTNTCDTIFTHFQGITNNIYGFGRLFAPSFFYLSTIFLPVHSLYIKLYMDANSYIQARWYILYDLKSTRNTRDTHFQGITDNIYDIFKDCCFFFYQSTDITTHPHHVLPVQMSSSQGGRGLRIKLCLHMTDIICSCIGFLWTFLLQCNYKICTKNHKPF